MNRQEFVERLNGNEFHFTRTCLATNRIVDDEILTPSGPMDMKLSSSIKLRDIHCYGDKDLFTEDFGVLLAVVKTGEGHLFCDRFEPEKAKKDI